MKNKNIIGMTTVCILCTSGIAFASDIKILNKNSIEYVPIKALVQKAGGKVEESSELAKVNIDGKKLTIEKHSSFVKIDERYYPLNKKELDGYEIPIDTKPLYQNKEIYIEKGFLKDNNLINYKIDKDKIVLNTQTQKQDKSKEEINKNEGKKEEEKKQAVENNIENNTQKPETPSRPTNTNRPNKPNRPSKPTGSTNNNNNSSSNNGNSNSSNNNNSNNGNSNSSNNNNSSSNNENSNSSNNNSDNNNENSNNSNTGSENTGNDNNTGGGSNDTTPSETELGN